MRSPTDALALWRLPAVSPRRARRMWQRDVTLYARSWKRNVLPNFFEPVLYLLSLGFGLGLYVGRQILGVEYADFITPGLAAVAAMNGAVFESSYNVFVKMRFAKLYDAVVTTPLEPADVAAGELMWALTRTAIYGNAFLLVLLVMGYVHSPLALLAPFATVLVGLPFALIGLTYTSLIPDIDLYSYYFTLFITPLFLFSGVFFPVSNLPEAAQAIAWLTPLHHGVELMRALVLTGSGGGAAAHALWLVVFAAIWYPPTVNLMSRRLGG